MTGVCRFSHVKYDSYKRSRLKQMGKSKYKTAIDGAVCNVFISIFECSK